MMTSNLPSLWQVFKFTICYFVLSTLFTTLAITIVGLIFPPLLGFLLSINPVMAEIFLMIACIPILYRTFKIVISFKFKEFRVHLQETPWTVWWGWFKYTFILNLPLVIGLNIWWASSFLMEGIALLLNLFIDFIVLHSMLTGRIKNPGIEFIPEPILPSKGAAPNS